MLGFRVVRRKIENVATREAARHLTAARVPNTQKGRPDDERASDRAHAVARVDRKAGSVRQTYVLTSNTIPRRQ